jgi:hypothetical protein
MSSSPYPFPTANTWEKYFLSSAKAAASDKLIEQITLKLSDGTTYPEAHKIFSQENDIFLMTFDKETNEIHLYHSLGFIGGSLSNPEKFMVALHGLGTASLPIVIGEHKVKELSFTAPSWNDFMTTNGNAEAFKTLQASATAHYKFKNLLPVTYQLMRAYVQSPAKDPASIGIAFINAYRKYDKLDEHEDNESEGEEGFEVTEDIHTYPKLSEKYLCALHYVWGAANDKFSNKILQVSYPQNAFIQAWSKQHHDICIAPLSSPYLTTPFHQTSSNTRDTIMIQAFTEMK